MTEMITFDLPRASALKAVTSENVYSTPEKLSEGYVRIGDKEYTYIRYGEDNQLPYQIREKIEKNSVMSQNKLFNLLTCYGRGIEYMDFESAGTDNPVPSRDPKIRQFLVRNSVKQFFAEQATDMKYYYFCVAVLILDRQRENIVKVVHKDACHIRFEKADEFSGRIGHVFYADWKDNDNPDEIEMVPLLDERDPLGDLLARTGREKDALGIFRPDPRKSAKYAVVCRMPTVGCNYYPTPYYSAVFRDGWYDIYGYLTAAKKAKLRNGQNIRYHVEINTQFWEDRARSRGISPGSDAFNTMKTEFIGQLKDYLSGSENSDKLIWSEFDALMDGKERHNLKINVVDTSKAGNEYNDDIAEVSNVLCYDDNVHPNLAGASPGKSQMNNSGSDKRELFTMKQALETLPHDMMMKVHDVIVYFNGWQDKVVPTVPMIMLTTLDKNTDAVETTTNNQAGNGDTGTAN